MPPPVGTLPFVVVVGPRSCPYFHDTPSLIGCVLTPSDLLRLFVVANHHSSFPPKEKYERVPRLAALLLEQQR